MHVLLFLVCTHGNAQNPLLPDFTACSNLDAFCTWGSTGLGTTISVPYSACNWLWTSWGSLLEKLQPTKSTVFACFSAWCCARPITIDLQRASILLDRNSVPDEHALPLSTPSSVPSPLCRGFLSLGTSEERNHCVCPFTPSLFQDPVVVVHPCVPWVPCTLFLPFSGWLTVLFLNEHFPGGKHIFTCPVPGTGACSAAGREGPPVSPHQPPLPCVGLSGSLTLTRTHQLVFPPSDQRP